MPVEQKRILPLYHFFDRLRQNEFPLGVEEYERFLTAIQKSIGLDIDGYTAMLNTITLYNASESIDNIFPKIQVFNLCRLLWLKPNQSAQLFEELFEETYSLDFPVAENRNTAPVNKLPETPGIPDPNPVVENADTKPPITPPPLESKKSLAEEVKTLEVMNEAVPVKIAIQAEAIDATLGLQQEDSMETEKSKFLFTSNYYPIDRRKTQQNLKQISSFGYAQKSPEIDVDATIQKTIFNGYFTGVVFKKLKINTTSLLLLIDHDGSMVAFEQLTNNIKSEAEHALMPDKKLMSKMIKTFYFYNSPGEYLYKNLTHTKFELTAITMAAIKNKSAGVIIISDAGAARGRYSTARVNATNLFLTKLHNYTNKIAWLNPLPKERWINTSAGAISGSVAMFEATENGIRNAVDLLRGNTTKFIREA